MAQKRFRCRHCGKLCAVRVEGQRYCGAAVCQRARRNRWRREKTASDADYRMNQRESTAAWLMAQGGAAAYHRAYRKRRGLRGMEACRCEATGDGEQSNLEAKGASLRAFAKSDATFGDSPIKPGRYLLISELAKRDATWVEIRLISTG